MMDQKTHTLNLARNNELFSPDDILLAVLPEKKLKFYIKKNLVEKISDNKYRLKFTPKGYGCNDDNYKLSDDEKKFFGKLIEHKCSVCESTSKIELHHIIPHAYRKELSDEMKDNIRKYSRFDVCLLCKPCHIKYERQADVKSREIHERFGLDPNEISTNLSKSSYAYKHIKNCYEHGDKIPPDRLKVLKQYIISFFELDLNIDDLTKEKLVELYELRKDNNFNKKYNVYAMLLDKLFSGYIPNYDFNDFCVEWRNHFNEHANPTYLRSLGWHPNLRYKI